MCLNNCKIVYPTTDIICYKYVKIRPDSDNHFTIAVSHYAAHLKLTYCSMSTLLQ